MFKKVLLALIIILVLIALWVRLFGSSQSSQDQTTNQQVTAQTNVMPTRIPATTPQAKLRFAKNPLEINEEGNVEAEVFLESNENKVTGVHFEIGYDPKVFAFKETKAIDWLGGKKITINSVDRKAGKITFEAAINASTTPPLVGGDETIAIELRPIANATGSQITFLPATTVTAEGVQGNALISVTNAIVK